MNVAISGEFGDDLRHFVYYRIENGSIREREEADTPAGGKEALLRQFLGLEIDLLIAGKISDELEECFAEAGIPLITGIRGKCDTVLKDYLAGELSF